MKKNVPNVAAYIADSPPERRAVLEQLRSLCREVLNDYEEEIDYGMPVYKRNGTPEIAFASQKQYISLYVMKKDVVDAHRHALADCSVGKGCIRFKHPDRVNFDVVRSLLRGTRKSDAQPC